MPIRRASDDDAPALADLCGQLGYTISCREILEHLDAINGRDDIAAFIFEEGARPIAWIELTVRHALESGRWAEITGFVVEESMRGRGVGSRLVDFAREWARERGLSRLRVRTNEIRTDTHRFYEREGFSLTKRHRVYDLAP